MTALSRRTLLSLAAAAPLALSAQEQASLGNLTLEGMELFIVPVNHRGNWLLVRLKTNKGLAGIGDASHSGHDQETVRALRQLFDALKGTALPGATELEACAKSVLDPGSKESAVARSAFDQCFADIRGKALAIPSSELFGGRARASIRHYANINRSTVDRSPEGFAAMAAKAIHDGFTAIKLAPFDDMPRDLSDAKVVESFTALGIARAQAVRNQIGKGRDLLIDAHSHFDLKRGLRLCQRMAPLNLFWLEEVTPATPIDALAAINRDAVMPTAGGESLSGVAEFYPYIAARAVDIVMPDVKACGGMWSMKKIAAIAEGAGLLVSPHGPASPIGNAAAAQIAATLPNFNILELAYGEVPWRAEMVVPNEELLKGEMHLSNRPGLGITLNDRLVQKFLVS